jgi:hypothetical protein
VRVTREYFLLDRGEHMNMTEELGQLLKNLKLRRILEFATNSCAPRTRATSVSDAPDAGAVASQARPGGRVGMAHLARQTCPERWTLETFPFARSPA